MTCAPHRHFIVPTGADLPDTTVAHILRTHSPETLPHLTIFVPTTRAATRLTRAFREHIAKKASKNQKKAVFLPHITPLTPDDTGLTPPALIAPLHRRFFLLKQVEKKAKLSGLSLSTANALRATQSLENLLTQLARYQVTPADFTAAIPPSLASHWEENTVFLSIILHTYPAYLAENNLTDPTAYQHTLFKVWATQLAHKRTKKYPLYAVGFQDTTPAGLTVLKAVAQHPQGHFIFPAWIDDLDDNQLETPTHPHYAIRQLMQKLALSETDLTPLSHAKKPPCEDITYLTPKTEEAEAHTIALLLKHCAHEKKTALVVTPHAQFGAKINTYLAAYGLVADDSAGTPFSQTPLGTLCLALTKTATTLHPKDVATLIRHPLFKTPDTQKHAISAFEKLVLRGLAPFPLTLKGYAKKLTSAVHTYPKPSPTEVQGAQIILDLLHKHLAPLLRVSSAISYREFIPVLVKTLHNLSDKTVYKESEETTLTDLFEALEAENDTLGSATITHKHDVLSHTFSTHLVRPKGEASLMIRGPLQARWEKADVTILANITSQHWPPVSMPHPWLHFGLLTALGLPTPAKEMGLTASHFFALVNEAKTLVLSHAKTEDGLDVLPSSLLHDFWEKHSPKTQKKAHEKGLFYTHIQAQIHQKDTFNLRPFLHEKAVVSTACIAGEKWSASFIEGIMNCPYKARLQRFLALDALPLYAEEEDARTKGSLFHMCLQAFFEQPPYAPPHMPLPFEETVTYDNKIEAQSHLMAIATACLYSVSPALKATWLAQFTPIATAFINHLCRNPAQKPALFEKRAEHPFGAVTLTASADRIDKTPSGAVIIDYKTGAPPKPKSVFSGEKPQLTIEKFLAENGAFGADFTTVSGLEFWRLGDKEKGIKITALNMQKNEDFTPDGLKNVVGFYTKKPQFSAVPAGSGPLAEGYCGYCDFSGICRFKNWHGVSDE